MDTKHADERSEAPQASERSPLTGWAYCLIDSNSVTFEANTPCEVSATVTPVVTP